MIKVKQGKMYEIMSKWGEDTQRIKIRVDWVEDREDEEGKFQYFGYSQPTEVGEVHGLSKLYKEPKGYGIQRMVEVKN